MPLPIILLAGPAGVGKSTTAAALEQLLLSYTTVQRLSFAGPLYETVSMLTGVKVSYLKAHKEEPLTAGCCYPWAVGRTPRKILQQVGEGMRQITDGRAWFEIASLRARSMLALGDAIIFDDARHAQEFTLGRVIELRREGIDYACDHPSAMPPPAKVVHAVIDLTGKTPEQAAQEIYVAVAGDQS